MLMDKKGQFDFLEDVNPFAYVTGIFGALIGWYMIKVIGGSGFSVSEYSYELPLIWKILTPVACAIGGFFVGAKMFE